MDSLLRDLRFVLRSFTRTPGFFVVTALTLALGIGATTAIYSVVDGVVLRPLPYPRSDRIVQLFSILKTGEPGSLSEPNYADWKAQARDFDLMAQTSAAGIVTVNGLADPVRARSATVSRDFFSVFRISPAIGHLPTEADLHRGAAPAVVVSDRFWRTYLDGTQSAIGRTITVENRLATVVGVMPPAMNFPAGTELWFPHEIDEINPSRSSGGWRVVARLRDGVTVEQAARDLSAISRRMKQAYGDDTWMVDSKVVPLQEQLVGNVRSMLFILLGASAFLLLIACANVVNLLVARAAVRRGELALRRALGASQWRLVAQALTESAVLAIAGGVGGIALAAAGVRIFIALADGKLPRADEVHLDARVLGFALVICAATALAIGLLAAWQSTRAGIREMLAESQRTLAGSGATIRRALVVSQMALTVVLLVGAGILGRSFVRLMDVDPGYRTNHALVLDAAFPQAQEGDGPSRRVGFYTDVMTQLRALPGVAAVGATNGVPLVSTGPDGMYLILTRPDEKLDQATFRLLAKDPTRSGIANFTLVDGDYFEAMGIPLEQGRGFRASDLESGQHVAVVSASLAKEKWPGQSAIGKVIQYGNMDGDLRPFTVVGVVGDVRDQSLAALPGPTFYAWMPQRAKAWGNLQFVVQFRGDPSALISSARAAVRRVRADLPVSVRTIDDVVSTSVADRRFVLLLIGVFGSIALLLASLGVYSVISYVVAQRRQEIGVRIALGATKANVLAMVLGQGATLTIAGLAVGGLGAFFLTRVLRGMVYGVSTTDPLAFAAVVILLALVAIAASWLPARRAAKVDPMNVLRGS